MNNLKTSHHLFHSFCIKPNYRFESQHPKEQLILVLRAHPFTQLSWILNSIFFIIGLILLNFLFFNFLSATQILFANLFGFSAIFAYVWFNFLGWYFNAGLITNERIVDVDFHSVIYKEITETKLSKIEDVTAKSSGFFASLFDYGNVFIQTAGTEVNIEFMHIPKPSEVTKIINGLTV